MSWFPNLGYYPAFNYRTKLLSGSFKFMDRGNSNSPAADEVTVFPELFIAISMSSKLIWAPEIGVVLGLVNNLPLYTNLLIELVNCMLMEVIGGD
jgi:hypothetical protein